jgi:hypothetical protein
MRWLAYLTVVLGVVAVGLVVYSCLPSDSPAPTGELPGEPAPPPAVAAPARALEGTITVEGEGLSPREKQVLAEGFRKHLSKAVHEAIKQAVEDLLRKLRITDDLERKLLAAADCRPGPDAGPEPDPDGPIVWSIHLIRPGRADRPPETVEAIGEVMTLRLTRASAAVERPVAVATLTWVQAGRLRQRERFLVYGPDGEWRVAEPVGAPDRGGGK